MPKFPRLRLKNFCAHVCRAGVFACLAMIAAILMTKPALACACCTTPAFRHVEVEALDAAKRTEIDNVRFAASAKLMLREADGGGLIEEPQDDYDLSVARQKDRLIFSLRDGNQRSGSLTLAMPKTVSVFEIDPRDGKDEGLGPILYKEWKLTANAAGDGLFRKVGGGARKMTLVLHGRGRACTDAKDFTHWTLLVYGPTDSFTLYGTLEPAKP